MAGNTAGPYVYDGFVSYRHDERQTVIARALQRALHHFAKPWYTLRACRLYRDETNLGANPDLWGRIRQALDDSRIFLLLGCPAAAGSPWVEREIQYWLETRGLDSIVIILTGGRLRWDPEALRFDSSSSDALPESSLGLFEAEPFWVDLTWVRKLDEELQLEHKQFRDAVATIAATLRGVDKDSMVGEDIRQRRKTVRIAGGALALIGLLAVLAIILAIGFREQSKVAEQQAALAREQRDEAVARLLAAEGFRRHQLESGSGIPFFLSSMRIAENPGAWSGLFQSLQEDPHIGMQLVSTTAPATTAAIRYTEGIAAIGQRNGEVLIWRYHNSSSEGESALAGTQRVRRRSSVASRVIALSVPEGAAEVMVLHESGDLVRWSLANDHESESEVVARIPLEDLASAVPGVPQAHLSANGKTAAVATWSGIQIWTQRAGLSALEDPMQGVGGPLAVGTDGDLLAYAMAGEESIRKPVVLYRLSSTERVFLPGPDHWMGALTAMTISPDNGWVAAGTMNGSVLIWRLTPTPVFFRRIEHPEEGSPNVSTEIDQVVFDGAARFVATRFRTRWHVWDLETGTLIGHPIDSVGSTAAYAGRTAKLLVETEENLVQLIDHSLEHLRYWSCLTSRREIAERVWRDLVGDYSYVCPCPDAGCR